ncbi:conjugative transfer protein MobI(A/C) [Pectobacterium brasiliense]|uniref:conjugative transfer protein MobI(A/C) n=1 Tax=Pectobacterium brasiliense TaxID=180957 RepID=UPI001CF3E8F2|nr:conjugative transfer protein MobI(A/C) [Pectobacterium brasiliense]MCA6984710.1 hypothetical protein [Pectobacterium brasiliense]MCH4994243.1 hypothetical protein [Pectobacterium brasiliense]
MSENLYLARLALTIQELDRSADVLVGEAEKIRKEYHDEVMKGGEFIPYWINLYKDGVSCRIRWAKVYIRKGENINPGRKFYMRYITKGKGDDYKKNSFKNPPVRFIELFDKYEPRLAKIRKVLKSNRLLRSRLAAHSTLYKDCIW